MNEQKHAGRKLPALAAAQAELFPELCELPCRQRNSRS